MFYITLIVLCFCGFLSAKYKTIDRIFLLFVFFIVLGIAIFFNVLFKDAPIISYLHLHQMIWWILDSGPESVSRIFLFSPFVYFGSKLAAKFIRTIQILKSSQSD